MRPYKGLIYHNKRGFIKVGVGSTYHSNNHISLFNIFIDVRFKNEFIIKSNSKVFFIVSIMDSMV